MGKHSRADGPDEGPDARHCDVASGPPRHHKTRFDDNIRILPEVCQAAWSLQQEAHRKAASKRVTGARVWHLQCLAWDQMALDQRLRRPRPLQQERRDCFTASRGCVVCHCCSSPQLNATQLSTLLPTLHAEVRSSIAPRRVLATTHMHASNLGHLQFGHCAHRPSYCLLLVLYTFDHVEIELLHVVHVLQ